MTLPRISVIVPTVDGRESFLEGCVKRYTEQAYGAYDLELLIERNHYACGAAWQAGADKATGDYLHFTDDDIEPHHGWSQPAIEAIERGFIPAPQVWGPHGEPQSHPQWGVPCTDWQDVYMTSLPFVSRAQYERIAPLFTSHYCSDDWFSYRAALAGWPTKVRVGYTFTHWWAQTQRGAGMPEGARLQYDSVLFEQAKKMVERGEWNAPWPPREIVRPNG